MSLPGCMAIAGAPVPALSTGTWLALVVALLVLGYAFLGAELYVIPGFGIAGILGIASLVTGVSLAWYRFGSLWGVGLLMVSLIFSMVSVVVVLKTRAGQRLMLDTSLAGAQAVNDEARRFVGAEGVAVTMLRPSGSVEFGDDRVEAETEGEFLPKGTRVRAVGVKLGRVVVEAARGAADGGPDGAAAPGSGA